MNNIYDLMCTLNAQRTHIAAFAFALSLPVEQLRDMAHACDQSGAGDRHALVWRVVVAGRQLDQREIQALRNWCATRRARKLAESAACN